MEKAKVLILLGSDSDIPLMQDGLSLLREMGVTYHLDISSAHRHPEKTSVYAKSARSEGFEVIIAAAGLAAHLPGVIASHTTLPVIGVPLKGGSLLGMDALLSMVQMPKGVPVATVGIDAARNACILACQILSIKYDEIREKLEAMKKRMWEEIDEKSRKLQNRIG
ncbi:MAG: N5-carboxyaminoimidazole ribonucleotide mutase [Syntrophorhabdaceae bacterium PtaU1.Bin034]|nr:MAG: N5-carboxyaminoimidazole ribonucleotide mutase [Syntrophorhabdaceae bacterium PtaU1.Bin034]